MKGNIRLAWLLAAAGCLSGCGGGETPALTPVATTEISPQFISYPDPNMFIQGEPITPLVPTITGGTPTNYLVQPDLPAGLRLDHLGRIVGTPLESSAPNTYLVTAGNSAGTTSFGVRITVMGRYTVGGVVFGLTGTGLVLTNNGGSDLAIGANGRFTFDGAFPGGYAFLVQVASQPSGQTCSITGGLGQITNINYADAVVTCSANAPKLTRSVSSLADALRAWRMAAEAILPLACLERTRAEPWLLGEPAYQFDALPGDVLIGACGREAFPMDPSGMWLYVPDHSSRKVSVYPLL
jgi:hypothetical protein